MSNRASNDIVILRRERVARLRARGLTQREIQAQLATKPTVARPNKLYTENPATGQGFDLATINRDLKWLREENLKSAAQSTDEHRADLLAELAEVRRAAWESGDLRALIKAIELVAKLDGVLTPGATINVFGDMNVDLKLFKLVMGKLKEKNILADNFFEKVFQKIEAAEQQGADGG